MPSQQFLPELLPLAKDYPIFSKPSAETANMLPALCIVWSSVGFAAVASGLAALLHPLFSQSSYELGPYRK